MLKILQPIVDTVGALMSWLSTSLRQTTNSYCELQTADSSNVLVAHDGSLLSVIDLSGVISLIGKDEFAYIQEGLCQALQNTMSQPGHSIQVLFNYNPGDIAGVIQDIYEQAQETSTRLDLSLDYLFQERVNTMSSYCSHEKVYMVLWTRLTSLTSDQLKASNKDKLKMIKKNNIPAFTQTQNILAAVPELRETHDSFVGSVVTDMTNYGLVASLLEVHDAVYAMRSIADPEFTAREWRAFLPGDKITPKAFHKAKGEVSDLLWPDLGKQILPRDAERLDLRTARLGDRIYSTVYIDLFPKEVQNFTRLFSRTLHSGIPWRISFLLDSDGLGHANFKSSVASVLTFTSSQNRLLSDSLKLLSYINLNTDDAVVKLRVAASTWAPEGETRLLRSRSAILAKAIEGWGSCDVSEICGDPFEGVVSTMMGVSANSPSSASIAPLSNVVHMLPLFRPSSPWKKGAILFRTIDGKPWPYHPGSHHQSTFIDLFYARPGSGKSVLSNTINLAACLSPGISRLPRIAIIDIGPSSSGLISLLQEALPPEKKNQVAYHRLQMTPEHAINPFDTQLGCRYPTPLERTFLVNFLTLLATPVGEDSAYDGIADMSGLIIDELYKSLEDTENPNIYSSSLEPIVDGILDEIDFVTDAKTTWWEITDALFSAGFETEALLAQRYAMPVLSDIAAICRMSVIEDLYGKITAPTGEPLIHAFSRMISSAVREYPLISQITQFSLGEARVVALDLDEVAKSGGDAANRQTAVMYMLARYVLAKNYYLTDDVLHNMPSVYRKYHKERINEIREDPKRIVYDEFHRTVHSQAVRDQVIVDMREGRKWKVQVALISQSLEDFDQVMVEFATSIFIMEAGPEAAVKKTAQVFGLTETAKNVLRQRVHGPREGGATFLAQFATKLGTYTQLLTNTLGPVELWALTTTADDANIRNMLYKKIGPKKARIVLAKRFPSGSAVASIESRLVDYKNTVGLIDDEDKINVIHDIVQELITMADNINIA